MIPITADCAPHRYLCTLILNSVVQDRYDEGTIDPESRGLTIRTSHESIFVHLLLISIPRKGWRVSMECAEIPIPQKLFGIIGLFPLETLLLTR